MQIAIKIGKNKGQQEYEVLDCPTIKHWRCVMDISQDTKLIPLTQGKFAIVDADDYDHLMQWKWFCSAWGCAARNARDETLLMHRVILSADKGFHVDHINGDPLNNSKSNLRLANHAQNQQNSKLRKNTTSKFKGVGWHKATRKWIAYIKVDYKHKHLGLFVDEKEAAQAYDAAALLYFGEFAATNEKLLAAQYNSYKEGRE